MYTYTVASNGSEVRVLDMTQGFGKVRRDERGCVCEREKLPPLPSPTIPVEAEEEAEERAPPPSYVCVYVIRASGTLPWAGRGTRCGTRRPTPTRAHP